MEIVIGIVALVIGYYIGKSSQQQEDYKKDPDNDQTLSDHEATMLFLTKEERYNLGRAVVLRKGIEKAKKALDNQIAVLMDAALTSLKEEGKI